jgi:hypothetical protein
MSSRNLMMPRAVFKYVVVLEMGYSDNVCEGH